MAAIGTQEMLLDVQPFRIFKPGTPSRSHPEQTCIYVVQRHIAPCTRLRLVWGSLTLGLTAKVDVDGTGFGLFQLCYE